MSRLQPDLLAGLVAIPGVIGGAVLDGQGDCLLHALQPPYEPVLIQACLSQFGAMRELMETLDPGAQLSGCVVHFEETQLWVRTADPYLVVVLASVAVNGAMLNVGLNALDLKLRGAQAIRGSDPGSVFSMPGARNTAPGGRGSAPGQAMGGGGGLSSPGHPSFSQPGQGAYAQSNPGYTTTNASLQQRTTAVPSQRGAVSIETLRGLARLLATWVGPAAQLVVKREVERLGFDPNSFPRERMGELVQAVSVVLPDAQARSEFLNRVGTLS
jgi:hypothetical protein